MFGRRAPERLAGALVWASTVESTTLPSKASASNRLNTCGFLTFPQCEESQQERPSHNFHCIWRHNRQVVQNEWLKIQRQKKPVVATNPNPGAVHAAGDAGIVGAADAAPTDHALRNVRITRQPLLIGRQR